MTISPHPSVPDSCDVNKWWSSFVVASCVLAICILTTVATARVVPYTGKGPPGTYVEPVPPPAPKIQARVVNVEVIKPPAKVAVPSECRTLAASVDLPTVAMTPDEVRKAKAMLRRAESTREVRRCRAAIDKGLRDARCDGPARYDAMREAHEAGRPQPC